MCCHHAESLLSIKAQKHRLRYCATNLRFSTRSELIDEEERALVTVGQELFHIEKMGAISTQVVFERLFITYVDKHILEDAALRVDIHRHGQSALHHILDKSYCLEAHRL